MSNAKKKAYKQAIAALPLPEGAIAPTLPERINRLTPSERHDLSRLLKSMKLRKIIKRTLAEAFWARESHRLAATRYESALTTFEPVITHSEQPTLIEVPR